MNSLFDPWGIASFESEFVSSQPYDVAVTLELPRTPSNLDIGNFMIDLALYSHPSDAVRIPASNASLPIAHSRRPALLTYTSPLVDMARILARLPLYVVGWDREAETLEVPMMEKVEFPRGVQNLPKSLRLQIHSHGKMQIYSARVEFRARFSGLRWIMYRWKLTSFAVFSSMFWTISMISASFTWFVLKGLRPENEPNQISDIKKVKEESRDFVKEESEAEDGLSYADTVKIKKEEPESDSSSSLLSNYPGDDEGLGSALQSAEELSVILPHQQRSWIGKAHLVGASVKPTYFRPGTLHHEDGTVHHLPRGSTGEPDDGGDEWILIDSTPASCVQIGLHHYFEDRGPIDLVVSGPNYGRNTTALFALSSGTIGAAMEGAVCGKRSIALSYAFSSRNHDPIIIAEASQHSVKLIEYLYTNWVDGVDLYSVNVPLEPGMSENKVLYTDMLINKWKSGGCFESTDPAEGGEPELEEQRSRIASETTSSQKTEVTNNENLKGFQHKHFRWAPSLQDVYRSVEENPPGNDGWVVKEQMTSSTKNPTIYSIVDCDDPYVQHLVDQALTRRLGNASSKRISYVSELPDSSAPLFQYREYERIDFEHVMTRPSTSLSNAYIIRKALIRKHYLSNTVANWIAKHPDSILRNHFKPAVDFELDYSEFLDEALLEAYELRESLEKNEELSESEREWWILKPGMSDRGQGIRLFNSEDQLREIFEEWDEDSDEEEDDCSENADSDQKPAHDDGVVTSQLRHFLAQPYIDPPLLLPSSSNRKFHIRTYVLATGSLKVYVFKEMLALFAAKPYCPPNEEEDEVKDLARHLTNTCFQEGGSSNEGSVRRFWDLDHHVPGLAVDWKEKIFDQICAVTGEVFEAAARGMMVHFQTLPNAFELFGVDFLVDASGNSWLLEFNAFPDFGQTGENLRDVAVGRLFEETVDVAVKPFFGLQAGGNGDLKLVKDLDLGRHA
ncbi:hypothetical protein N7495_008131 [Penicillium taxi]|uniref:uncharacterized protein n=1 Tax=Penicillium taxi TaxID=168475 RepID=UPI00254556E9|nr:uncharacterized protein N7495_008131 [Penicillium taxi]KAJ5888090.1 hypothetical protein N7495_008131 [Penicillium taxi]